MVCPARRLVFVVLGSVLISVFFFPPLCVCGVAGDVLFQMAEVHRQIQIQLEEMVSVRH